MEILLLLVPMSVVLALLIGAAFWWSVQNGQFDDLEGPAQRVVGDDDAAPPHASANASGLDADQRRTAGSPAPLPLPGIHDPEPLPGDCPR
jgi:cbb3-type cytochrome oxidase maturation protein